ncbi:MAG: Txe/YoeB family addiction module toxin [Bacteroidales bacterium]
MKKRMEKYTVNLSAEAKEDMIRLEKSGEKSEVKRLEELLNELSLHPENGIGKPEELDGPWSGCWSRRINEKNRLVYQIDSKNKEVTVLKAIGHYNDH